MRYMIGATVQIKRDPFARTTLVRRTIVGNYCYWCGQERPGRGRLRLFEYGTQDDMNRTDFHKGKFCSKACHDCYHGV